MNYLLAASFTFKSVVCIALTLVVMFIALFYLQGFGLLCIITLLVLDRVVSYVNKIQVWFTMLTIKRTFHSFDDQPDPRGQEI